MWHHGRWGMLNIGIGMRVGVDVVVLRRNVMPWRWIVPRHLLRALEGLRNDGMVVMIVGAGKLAGVGSTSFKVLGLPGVCRQGF